MLKFGDYQVYFKHHKEEAGFTATQDGNALFYRGRTECFITDKEEVVSYAEAMCSVFDTFDKAKGRKPALARALSVFPVEFRSMVWDMYLGTVKRV